MEVASSEKDNQPLHNLLTKTDAVGDLSDLAQAIKDGGKKKTVPKFCATRWTARVSTLSALLAKYVEVLRALERIRYCSTCESRSDASSRLGRFTVCCCLNCFTVLSILGSVTTALQSRECNLADAYHGVALARECICDSRNEDCWNKSRTEWKS